MAEWVTYYLIAVNVMTFAVFGLDKGLAEGGRRRISEATLLNISLIGGTIGAYAGRQVFRHKTRKQRFSLRLHTIAALQVVATIAISLVLWWETLPMAAQSRAEQKAVEESVYYEGCNEVRALGKAPLYRGDPGYGSHMDGDGDGIACEPRPDEW